MNDKYSFKPFLIAFVIAFILLYLKWGRDMNWVVMGITLGISAILFIVSYLCRKRFRKNNDNIPQNEESKEYKSKSIRYAAVHGFDKIKGKSMKEDLIRHFQSSGILSFLFLGILLTLVGVLPISSPLWVRIAYAAVGILCLIYSFYRLSGAQVKRFVKFLDKNGENIEEINSNYMKGRLAFYKKSGICIGEKYTVCWSKDSKIFAVKNCDIAYLQKDVQTVEHYSKSLFIGGDRYYQIKIHTKVPYYASRFLKPKDKLAANVIIIDLKQFQDDMVLEEYKKMNIDLKEYKSENGFDDM